MINDGDLYPNHLVSGDIKPPFHMNLNIILKKKWYK